jgi:CDP-6-deoxy-D-xylo-4-hexulose-3-dehydrase
MDHLAAIGLVQLEKFEEIRENRKNNKRIIAEMFEQWISLYHNIYNPMELPKADVSNFGVAFVMKDKDAKNKLVSFLEKNKIQTRGYFAGNVLTHEAFKHLGNYKDYPNSNLVNDSVFFVGCYPGYTSEMIQYIKDVLKSYVP